MKQVDGAQVAALPAGDSLPGYLAAGHSGPDDRHACSAKLTEKLIVYGKCLNIPVRLFGHLKSVVKGFLQYRAGNNMMMVLTKINNGHDRHNDIVNHCDLTRKYPS